MQTVEMRSELDQEKRFFALSSVSPIGLFLTDQYGKSVYANQRACEMTGLSLAQTMNDGWVQALYPGDRERVVTEWQQAVDQGLAYRSEHRFCHADGKVIWVLVAAGPEYDEEGRIKGYVGSQTDITRLREMERVISEKERNFQSLTTDSPVGFFQANARGRMTYLNRKAEECWGMPFECVVDEWFERLYVADRERITLDWSKAIANKVAYKGEFRIHHQQGHIVWVYVHAQPVFMDNGELESYVGTLIDITEAREYQERTQRLQNDIAHSTRVNLISEMASGISHELNQPLAGIVCYAAGCLELLKKEDVSPKILLGLEKVMAMSERAGAIIHRLNGFLRKGDLAQEWLDVNVIVQESIELARVSCLFPDLVLEENLQKDLPQVFVDRVQISQVILNIFRNAADVLQDDNTEWPRIVITTRTNDNNHVEVCIEDNGPGIVPEILDSLFNSFVTTKSSGMGVGLSVSRTIMEAHRGDISVRSAGLGASFFLTLPTK